MIHCFMFYVLCFMFYVLCFMFYVLCFMFYVLCFLSMNEKEEYKKKREKRLSSKTYV